MDDKSVEIILFEAIQTALNTVTELKSVEAWNSQNENESRERPRLYPFVGVEINTEWMAIEGSVEEYDQNQQKGDCVVTIHYIYEQIETETNQWLTQRAIVHKVFRELNGLQGEQFDCLTRTSTPHEDSHDLVSDIQINFSTTLLELAYNQDDKPTIEVGDFSVETQNDLIIDNDIIRSGSLDSDVVDPVTGEITFNRISGSGEISVPDGDTSVINIGKVTDKNIKVNIVFQRGTESYSQELDILNNDGTFELGQGEINPYIDGDETLGLTWSVSLVDNIIKLGYTLSVTGTDGTLYYVYNKIV